MRLAIPMEMPPIMKRQLIANIIGLNHDGWLPTSRIPSTVYTDMWCP